MSSKARKLRRIGKTMKQPEVLERMQMALATKMNQHIDAGAVCCCDCGIVSGMRGVTLTKRDKKMYCQECLSK